MVSEEIVISRNAAIAFASALEELLNDSLKHYEFKLRFSTTNHGDQSVEIVPHCLSVKVELTK